MHDLSDDVSAPAPLRANVEQLLTSLTGVISAHVGIAPDGALSQIHVLAAAGLHPKQVVRNVESALSAGLGLEVDRRNISVAQIRDAVPPAPAGTGTETPAGAVPHSPAHGRPVDTRADRSGTASGTAAPKRAAHVAHRNGPRGTSRRIVLTGYETRLDASRRASCRVALRAGPDEFHGEARGPDTPRGRADAAANAVFAALAAARGKTRFGLEGVTIVDVDGRDFVLVAARAFYDRRPVELTGAAHLDRSPEEAAILASLQAINRWEPPAP
ncbi:MAG TPA: hypothetical protein VF188_15185 [Longimicrobiales bacterium]